MYLKISKQIMKHFSLFLTLCYITISMVSAEETMSIKANSRETGNEFSQQAITITGTVTDALGEPLPGVSVTIKGISRGTSTDANGAYSLPVQDGNAILVFSYIGFVSQEQTVGDRRTINVALYEETLLIEEVVVIGYGTRAKKDLTGAISQISSEEITRKVALSPELAMQGTMAGVFVSNAGSNPTARPEIRIRGVTTLGYNEPLFVVDGVPLFEGLASSGTARDMDMRGGINVLTMFNQNDIETISVLKDASATAIYGVRASNGVVLITTKRGAEGRPKVSLTTSYGIQNIFKRHDLVTPQENVDMTLRAIDANKNYNKAVWYALYDKNSREYLGNSPDYSKDWMDAGLMKNAPIQDYNLSVTGGTKMSNYAVGAGFSNQENAMYKQDVNRYSFFMNSDHNLTKWLKVGESYRLVLQNVRSYPSPSFDEISYIHPWQPLYDASQPNGYALVGRAYQGYDQDSPTENAYGWGQATRSNFLAESSYRRSESSLLRHLGSFYAEISPLNGLRIRGTFSFDTYSRTGESLDFAEYSIYRVGTARIHDDGTQYQRSIAENVNVIYEFLAGYAKKIGEHSIDIVANAMSQKMEWKNFGRSIKNSPIVDWKFRYIDEGWPLEDMGGSYERRPYGLIGYMGRLSYNYASKYYLDATVRRDGTSRFGPGYKWGTFPSFAAAWRISSERFMENIAWLNDLKLRGGWGQTGNQETLDFAYLALINENPRAAFGNNTFGVGSGTLNPAVAYANYPVTDMTWETVTSFTLGFDMVVLQNKLNLTAEYYNRDTEGILQTVVIPWTIGAPGSPRVNLADVNNKGVELQVGYHDRFGEVGFNASVNLTTVKNRVYNLYRGLRQGSGSRRIENGKTMNYLYGYKTDGIFQTQAEVDAWKEKNKDTGNDTQKAPGDIKFVDINRAPNDSETGMLEVAQPDGTINSYDQTYIGKTIPGYYYGFNVGADYKNLDVYLSFRGVGDVQGISSYGINTYSGGGGGALVAYRNSWTPENQSKTIPRAIQDDPSGNNRTSDRHVHNAGFLRFQNFQIGYNFKGDVINKVGISNLRCYLSGSNLFVIAPGWPEPDPEDITTPVVFTFGVNVSF